MFKQYILVVNQQRGFQGISLYAADPNNPIDTTALGLLAGGQTGFTTQQPMPNGSGTFTVTVGEP